MTAFAVLFVGLAACAVAWQVGMAAVRALETRWTAERAMHNARDGERIALEERRVQLEESLRAPRPKAQPMPAHLRNRIASLEDDWAREDEERTIMALYGELDNWEKVSQALRPLATSESVDRIYTPEPEFVR